jgi:hypothetical protein
MSLRSNFEQDRNCQDKNDAGHFETKSLAHEHLSPPASGILDKSFPFSGACFTPYVARSLIGEAQLKGQAKRLLAPHLSGRTIIRHHCHICLPVPCMLNEQPTEA